MPGCADAVAAADTCAIGAPQRYRVRLYSPSTRGVLKLQGCDAAEVMIRATAAFLAEEVCLELCIEFWRALILFLQDPAAPPVGDRLRDSHKIRAFQAVPPT
ncbi:hypothetical protein MRX96_012516 [Rhipicephalus microplus]